VVLTHDPDDGHAFGARGVDRLAHGVHAGGRAGDEERAARLAKIALHIDHQ
jgi:hypothetical protein